MKMLPEYYLGFSEWKKRLISQGGWSRGPTMGPFQPSPFCDIDKSPWIFSPYLIELLSHIGRYDKTNTDYSSHASQIADVLNATRSNNS